MDENLNIEDRNLWDRMRGGDEEALASLFRRYYAMLYDYGLKLSQQEELAKDGIQEVFAYLWEKRKSLVAVDSVRTYLLVALRRHLLNALIKQRKRQNTNQKFSMEQDQAMFSFEDLLILKEEKDLEKKALQTAMENIPARIREALYLKTYDGLTYQEIAVIMKVTPQVARNYVSEAFHRLREIFSQNL